MSNRLAEFNGAVQKVTDQRGAIYGHPRRDFDRAARLKSVVAECNDPIARHALEMICVKLARLIEAPTHLDSWIDIAGYARTGVMVTEDDGTPIAEFVARRDRPGAVVPSDKYGTPLPCAHTDPVYRDILGRRLCSGCGAKLGQEDPPA